jgi:hypothetical protein
LVSIQDAVAFVLVTTAAGILVWGLWPYISLLLQPRHQFNFLLAENMRQIEEVRPYLSFVSKIEKYEDVMLEAVKVTARETSLVDCRASVTIDGRFSDYLRWDDGNEMSTLRRGEHDYAIVWYACKMKGQATPRLFLNTGSNVPFEIGHRNKPQLDLRLTFIGNENYQSRPFKEVLPLTSWESLRLSLEHRIRARFHRVSP